jgi:hypothetical protein
MSHAVALMTSTGPTLTTEPAVADRRRWKALCVLALMQFMLVRSSI